MGLSHGLFLGNRQLMILSPSPLLLTALLCSSIHRRTWWLTCQEALSQIKTQTPLPAASSFSQHHERKRVVIPLTGRPSTKRSHTSSNSAKTTHNRRWPWGRDRLWRPTAPPDAG